MAFLIFDVLVPEGVGKEVETNVCRSSLEKPTVMLVLIHIKARAEEEKGAGIIHRRAMSNMWWMDEGSNKKEHEGGVVSVPTNHRDKRARAT